MQPLALRLFAVYQLSMSDYHIFIDGAAGTTGLQVQNRLAKMDGLSLILLDEQDRKDEAKRMQAMADADISILCLPDDAAKAAAQVARSAGARIIDASTAHRTASDFSYGFAELWADGESRIAEAQLVSNPGCYPTGFLALIKPLVEQGMLSADRLVHVSAVSGYSGGGKAMIAAYEAGDAAVFGTYGLSLGHKHLPEMRMHAGLNQAPVFLPSVGNFAQGMLVNILLDDAQFETAVSTDAIMSVYREKYKNSPIISIIGDEALNDSGFLAADSLAGTDRLELAVFADHASQRIVLTARLDNLGKGASGAAVQNLNLMLGRDMTDGLSL